MSTPTHLPPIGGRGLCLLSLDGGGVRALSSLLLLREVMRSIDPNNPPRPCDYFDLIGGSEAGGLIAIMLGRLGMGIDECIEAFLKVVKGLYQPATSKYRVALGVPLGVPIGGSLGGYLQSKSNTSELQQVLQDLVLERLHDKDALLLSNDAPCKVFVTASSPSRTSTMLLRSYKTLKSVDEDFSVAAIWQAAEATVADPTLLDSIEIAGEKLSVAAPTAIYPVQQLWMEAANLWTRQSLTDSISCIVSVGTGIHSFKSPIRTSSNVDLIAAGPLPDMEKTIETLLREHFELSKDHRYLRLNADNGLDSIGLDEAGVEDKITSLTSSYMTKIDVEKRIKDCASYLVNECDYRHYMVALSNSGRDEGKILAELTKRIFQGAGSWIFKDIYFKRWISGKSTQALWIHGGGGSGKTTLAAAITQEISMKSLTETGRHETILAYFFCSYKHARDNNIIAIIKSLIYQILLQRPDLYSNLHNDQKLADKYSGSSISLDILAADFIDLLNSPGPKMTYFVIDGLDECSQESIDRLFGLIAPYLDIDKRYSNAGSISTLKWLFISEEVPDIARHLGAIPHIALETQVSETSSDVEEAIDEVLKELAQPPTLISHDLGEFTRGYLRKTAEGSVTWVKLVGEKLQANADSSPASVASLLSGSSPLLWAAFMGLNDVVETLLDRGADVDATDLDGNTALILASETNHAKTATILIDNGSDVNVKRFDGRSALQVAVDKGSKEVVELLLRSGADSTVTASYRKISSRKKLFRETSDSVDEISRLLQDRPLVQGPGSLEPGLRVEADFLPRPKLPDSYHAQNSCNIFTTSVIDFFDLKDQHPREWRIEEKLSVYDLIYGQGAEKIMASLRSSTGIDPLFRWYHLPANNLAWALMYRIMHDRKARTVDFDDQVKEQLGMARSSGYQHRGITPHSCFMRPICQEINLGAENGIMLFMPYLEFEYDESRAKLAASIETMKTMSDDAALPASTMTSVPDSIDHELINGYLRSYPGWKIPPLHIRRTLDQYFYNELLDTSKRDTDQVVFRYTKKHTPHRVKIFMVDQLWMWILDNGTVITSCPQRWGQASGESSPPDIFSFILLQLRSKTRSEILSVQDLAFLITNCCTRTFGRYRTPRILDEYQFFDMFESSIGTVSDRETKAFDVFKENVTKANPKSKPSDREEALNALFDILEEIEILTEIKDIRDELKILRIVLEEQAQILEKLFSMCQKSLPDTNNPANLLGMNKIHRDHIDEMDKRASDIYDSVNHLLNLKQKQTNAAEARFARQQTEDTSRQGQTVLVFTVVTIIFGLLSFMTAIFALNLVEFSRNPDGTLNLDYVSKYIFGISLGVSIPLVLIAIYIARITDWFSRIELWALKPGPTVTAAKIIPLSGPASAAQVEKSDKPGIAVTSNTTDGMRRRKALGDEEVGNLNHKVAPF